MENKGNIVTLEIDLVELYNASNKEEVIEQCIKDKFNSYDFKNKTGKDIAEAYKGLVAEGALKDAEETLRLKTIDSLNRYKVDLNDYTYRNHIQKTIIKEIENRTEIIEKTVDSILDSIDLKKIVEEKILDRVAEEIKQNIYNEKSDVVKCECGERF